MGWGSHGFHRNRGNLKSQKSRGTGKGTETSIEKERKSNLPPCVWRISLPWRACSFLVASDGKQRLDRQVPIAAIAVSFLCHVLPLTYFMECQVPLRSCEDSKRKHANDSAKSAHDPTGNLTPSHLEVCNPLFEKHCSGRTLMPLEAVWQTAE